MNICFRPKFKMRSICIVFLLGISACSPSKRLPLETPTATPALPSEARALYAVGSIHLAKGELDEGISKLTAAARQFPESVVINAKLARAWILKARLTTEAKDRLIAADQARRAIERIWDPGREFPEDFQTLCNGLGDLWISLKGWTQAEQCFQWAWEINKEDVDPLLKVGTLRLAKQEWKSAEEAFRTALKQEPGDEDTLRLMAELYWQTDKPQRSIRILKELIAEPDPNTKALRLYAQIMEAIGRPEDARRAYQMLLDEEPDHVDALRRLADLAQDRRDWCVAIELYRKLLETDEKDNAARFGLAVSLERAGLFGQSVREFMMLLASEPDRPEVLNYLGYMYAEKGIYLDEAERLIQAALIKEPRSGAYVDSMGWVHYQRGNYKKALELLLLAHSLLLEEGEDDAVIREHLGDAFARLGQTDDAMSQWRRAKELDPSNECVKMKLKTRGLFPDE